MTPEEKRLQELDFRSELTFLRRQLETLPAEDVLVRGSTEWRIEVVERRLERLLAGEWDHSPSLDRVVASDERK